MASPFPQITTPPQALAEVLVNNALETLQTGAVYGKAHLMTTGLTWGYYGGRWGGFAITAGTLTLSASGTNYVAVAKATGVISTSTSATNWNDATNYARVYKLTTSASAVTAEEDHRSGPGGVQGGSASTSAAIYSGFEYSASSTTTDSDPGTGVIRWNNSTQASATTLYIDNAEADGASLATLWASLQIGSMLKIVKADDPEVWQVWKVTAAPVNGTGYYKFTGALQGQEGSNIGNGVGLYLNVDAAASPTAGPSVSTLTDGATINVDASLAENFRVVLGGNRTLANPTNLTSGQVLNFRLIQDGTGSRTLAYGSKYKFAGGTAPILSTAASAKDFMSCQYDATDDTLFCSTLKALA